VNLTAPFIRRPVATYLLAIAVLLAGAAAFTQLPVAPLPKVDYPTISVNASLPGASPATMASAVATPLERRFGRIAGLNELTSTSALGTTDITMQFDLDRDPDSVARDVQAAINAAGGDLPPNLPSRPRYQKVNPSDSPILIFALQSQTVPPEQIYDAANSVLAQKIAQVAGVGQVFVGGAQAPAVRISVAPEALAGAGLGFEDLRAAIQSQTANGPKGAVAGDATAAAVAANDQRADAASWRDLVVRFQAGAPLRLSDVARVDDGVENDRSIGWSNKARAVLVIIRRQPGANILEVTDRVRAIVPVLTRSISPAIDVEVAMDRSETIRASVRDVERALVVSVILVVLVVFLFLRSGRATVIPSVAVPLSLVATFGVMWLLGYSIDNFSLMALTISTGFVVDDAIVMVENITRHTEQGLGPLEAALRGAKQIGFTIVSITGSLLAVFVPLLLMAGVAGRLFREFAITLAAAVVISALISLTLTPTMASVLLRPGHGRAGGAIARLVRGYDRALTFVLRHRFATGLVTLGAIAVSVSLYIFMPKGLFPQQDTGLLNGFSDAPQDISFPAMRERSEKLLDVLTADPDIDHANMFVGGQGTQNTGRVFIYLKPRAQRTASADEIIARLRPKLAQVPGIALYLQSVQDVRIGGRFARTQYQYTLQDANLDELMSFAPRMLAKLRTVKVVRDVATDQQTAGLELDVTVDRDSAARLGVGMKAIDDTLYDAFGQRQVATLYGTRNQYHVILEMSPAQARTPAALDGLWVRNATGGLVPLGALAEMHDAPVPLSVNHQGQFASVTLSFNTPPGVALSEAVDAIHQAEREIGMPEGVHATFQGTAAAFKDSADSEPMLILAALIAVYIVLGMLYESLIHPLTILSTLPSAGVGALLALLLFKLELSLIALVGIILLIGIVKKNAILMIDFALEAERDEGLDPVAAIHKACLLRFRPIMMTTLAAMFGALPLVLGGGAGSEMRRPLGVAIVGGLLLSQALTLFTTPVVYLALDRFTRARHRAAALAPSAG
jgi:hydrophobe/amphiphile efflux-1 (HAE1) family protein